MQDVLILGDGQIGAALKARLPEAVVLGRDALDFLTLDEARAAALLAEYQPKILINAAAYTAVDKAESEREEAFQVNAYAVGALAKACKVTDTTLVHYSTDYVFAGEGDAPHAVDAPIAPLNVYGESKALGEALIRESVCRHQIFRTSWVYDAHSKNFLTTMLRLGKERESLSVVSDQIGAPTYAGHIAEATIKAMHKDASGTFHMVNEGHTSWHGFAEAIFEAARAKGETLAVKQVQPIVSEAYPTPAKRPKNSRLCSRSFKEAFGFTLPPWQEGLSACMNMRYAHY